jgi:hypothetical protein
MNLYEKMLKVTEEVQNIEKKGFNAFNKYKYVQAVDVIEGVQKALIRNKIYLNITEIECIDSKEAKEKGFNFFSRIKCHATFINAEKPDERIDVDYYGQAADSLDKQLYKAKTNGLKYLLTQQFLLVTDVLKDVEDDANVKSEPVNIGCEGCGLEIDRATANFSMKAYHKALCINCQKVESKKPKEEKAAERKGPPIETKKSDKAPF